MDKDDIGVITVFLIIGIIGFGLWGFMAYSFSLPNINPKKLATFYTSRDHDIWLQYFNNDIAEFHVYYDLPSGLIKGDVIIFQLVTNPHQYPFQDPLKRYIQILQVEPKELQAGYGE